MVPYFFLKDQHFMNMIFHNLCESKNNFLILGTTIGPRRRCTGPAKMIFRNNPAISGVRSFVASGIM